MPKYSYNQRAVTVHQEYELTGSPPAVSVHQRPIRTRADGALVNAYQKI